MQTVRFTGTLPAGHVEQTKASLMFEKPVLLQFEQIPLLFEELWTTKEPGPQSGLNTRVKMLLSNANIVEDAFKLTLMFENKAVDFNASKNDGMRH